MRLSRALAAGLVAVSTGAGAEAIVTQHVPGSCPSLNDERREHDLEIKIPEEIAFRVGYRWTALPATLHIGGESFGATKDGAISAVTPSVIIGIGTASNRLKARLVVSDRTLCDPAMKIEAGIDLKDRRSERMRVRFVAGLVASTSLDAPALQAARASIRADYEAALSYLFDQRQPWLSEYLSASVDDSARKAFAMRFCDECNWRQQQRLALALARFIETYPEVMRPGTPLVENVTLRAVPPAELQCGSAYGWSADSLLQVVLHKAPSDTYVQLRSRRDMALDALSLERVVIGGKVIATKCD